MPCYETDDESETKMKKVSRIGYDGYHLDPRCYRLPFFHHPSSSPLLTSFLFAVSRRDAGLKMNYIIVRKMILMHKHLSPVSMILFLLFLIRMSPHSFSSSPPLHFFHAPSFCIRFISRSPFWFPLTHLIWHGSSRIKGFLFWLRFISLLIHSRVTFRRISKMLNENKKNAI